MKDRVGVFGGTFDPIHYGHLIAAEEARQRSGLSRVVFVPAGAPPHKLGEVITEPHHRVNMVQLATKANPFFSISFVDLDRVGPSYTVDTIAALGKELEEADIFFMVGMDLLHDLLEWREPARLLEMCYLLVMTRPGWPTFDRQRMEGIFPKAADKMILIEVPAIGISASDLRRRVATGRSIRYQVPEDVERYIEDQGLYRSTA